MSQPVTAACTACARAKRKCGKQKPACLRCHKRGVRCAYPPQKPSAFLLVAGEGSSRSSTPRLPATAVSPEHAHPPYHCEYSETSFFSGGSLAASQEANASFRDGVNLEIATFLLDSRAEFQLATDWFAGPDTWTSRQMPPTVAHTYSKADLETYSKTTQDWLQTWVDTGSNPFIHSHLYKARYPPCVQDAYLAATSYTDLHNRNVTPARKQMVHRTIEEKMLSLLETNAVPSDWASPQDLAASCFVVPLDDPLEHIARVHGLLIYQLIGLFESENVRLRQLAERHIPVLYLWMQCMVQCCASQAEFLGECMTSPKAATASSPLAFTARPGCDELIWQTWIMAECVRRAWIVISGIQAVYLMVQKQSALIRCMGGMMVTTRKGPWEAASAQDWLRICSEVNVGLVQMAEAHNQFSSPTTAMDTAKDPDEFIKFALLVGHGKWKVSEWDLLT